MIKHDYFNLKIHSNEEIEGILNCKIYNRETIHEWPLSSVHKIISKDGVYIYKSEFGPSVEIDFLENNKFPFLPEIINIIENNEYKISIRKYVDGQTLELNNFNEISFRNIINSILIKNKNLNNKCVYLDLSSHDKLNKKKVEIVSSIHYLINNHAFKKLNITEVNKLDTILSNDNFYKNSLDNLSLVHGDLTGDNIIVNNQDVKIIDWQRPIITNQFVDEIKYCQFFNLPISNKINKWCLVLNEFITINWAIECKLKWFSDSSDYEDWVINSINKMVDSHAKCNS